ncbi:MAG: UDP-glucose 4-epimerase GalE [Dokdonella sp.]|uniref:UDP-glucose 4-epimerase GalE n=1 Tax=Dokdonella sp. TaxID=2291710 RepID=UPI003F7F7461
MRRVAVTGGAGYIGSHMCKQLADHGHDVIVIDDLSSGHREAVRWGRLVQCSLLDAPALSLALRDARCDAVIHFAGAIAVGESVDDPLRHYAINVGGSLNLLRAMRDADVRRIVFSSSAAIFGEPRQAFIDEAHPIDPISPYGRSKAMVERMLQDAASAYGIGAVALRYFNAAGAEPSATIGESHEPETHLIPRLLRAARDGLQVEIYGDDHPTPDGTCIRDYVHVDDLCSAHLAALDHLDARAGFHAFNLGNGNGCSVREVIAAVRAVTGRAVDVRVAGRRAGDPARLVACTDRVRAGLGWKPATPALEAIVESAWRWHRAPAY